MYPTVNLPIVAIGQFVSKQYSADIFRVNPYTVL